MAQNASSKTPVEEERRPESCCTGNVTRTTDAGAAAAKVLAISGSLQTRSSNSALVRLAQRLANERVRVDVFDALESLPYFNPDLDVDPAPLSVGAFRAEVGAADALLIATPEYAHEMPGVLKNALEWLVSSGELYTKPVAVLCAAPGPQRGGYAREALERTLSAEGARIILSRTVAVAPGVPVDESAEVVQALDSALDALSANLVQAALT
jgi:NAD(P)H-dependent FMN reductase